MRAPGERCRIGERATAMCRRSGQSRAHVRTARHVARRRHRQRKTQMSRSDRSLTAAAPRVLAVRSRRRPGARVSNRRRLVHQVAASAPSSRPATTPSRSLGAKVSIGPPPAPVAVSLGTFSFEVGPNCYSCTRRRRRRPRRSSRSTAYTQPAPHSLRVDSSGPNDFLTFSRPAPLVFDFGNHGSGHRPGRDRTLEPGGEGVRRPVRDRRAPATYAGAGAGQLRADARRLRRRRVRRAPPQSLTPRTPRARREKKMVPARRVELPTFALRMRCSTN